VPAPDPCTTPAAASSPPPAPRGAPSTGSADSHLRSVPLTQAAQACYRTPDRPHDVSVPGAGIEFEVANSEAVADAAQELQTQGYALLHQPRTEPWAKRSGRILSREGLIVGLSFAPSLHDQADPAT
jgi:hypothetical protein